jgi:enoyl-CoA hydratase/carnithine racemase
MPKRPSTPVQLETPADGVALVTVAGPAPNGCSFAVVEAIAAQLAQAREAGARVSVLASGTAGHWLGHASLRDLGAMFRGEATSGEGAAWFHCVRELSRTSVVTIAAVSGDCAGGGAELGWACDLRVAEENAHFAQPEVMIGVPTGLGGTARLARLIGRSAAAEMVLDGAALSARRLYELGAVNRVVENGRSLEASLAWAARLASRPPAALAAIKTILTESDDLPLTEALANEQRHFQEVARTPGALERMAAMQARYDAGELPADIYDPPFDALKTSEQPGR